MKKKLQNSLSVKIFWITCLLLMAVSILTYGFIAWVMPLTYTADRNQELESQVKTLLQRLEKCSLEESKAMIEQFALENDADVAIADPSGIRLFSTSESGEPSALEGGVSFQITQGEEQGIPPLAGGGHKEASMTAYTFSFSSDSKENTLIISGSMKAVNQAVEALGRIWPWLLLAILILSVLCSLFYSRYLARPIVRLSGISRKMSNLEFDWHCDEGRSDEIGVLAHSLNELSERLSSALSELRTANAALREDIDRERELERQRLEFFSVVSHELKTPITVIKGQLGGMLEGVGVYADRDRYLSRALTVVNRMEGMVQELVNIYRMESSDFSLRRERVELSGFLKSCLEQHLDLIEGKGLRLSAELEEELFVWADGPLLLKAFGNLLSNAVCYSPPGAKIRLFAGRRETAIHVSLENTGVQIPEAALPHLFEAFYRVEQSRSRKTGGSGLGLYLVKMILERHKIGYRMENTAEGVRFSMELPE